MSKTKKSLVLSCLSMLLCVSMLIGATFAWFTDNASTGVNSIQAGTLDIDLQMKDANGNWVTAEGETLDFVKASGAENEAILWEPGCTYELPELRLVNNSDLALKYKILISGIKGDAELNKAIEWTIQLDNQDLTIGEEMHWAPADADTKAFTISGSMKKDAGNEYQGLSIEGISIIVVAAQDTVESDSFTNQYDANAKYDDVEIVAEPTNDALAAAISSVEDGGTIVLPAGTYTMPDAKDKAITITGTKETKVSVTPSWSQALSGADLVFDGVTIEGATTNYQGYTHANSVVFKNCTLTNLQFLFANTVSFENCELTTDGTEHNIWTYGSKNVSFTDCAFSYSDRAVNVYTDYNQDKVNVTFTRCSFTTTNTASKGAVEINSSAFPNGATVSFVDCTAPANGTMVGISGWDSTNGATANVTIDGAAATLTQWAK